MMHKFQRFSIVFLIAALVVFIDFAPGHAQTCSNQYSSTSLNAASGGLISAIMGNITSLLQKTGDRLYNQIIGDPAYTASLQASVLLLVVIYGVMIVFDLANLRPGEIMSRIIKVGTIVWLASPGGGWDFFSNTFAKFFYGTMLELINLFLGGAAAGIGGSTGSPVSASQLNTAALADPLSILGYPIALLFSAKFGITILGVLGVGVYGIAMFFILIWAGFYLLLAMFQALFVYVKCIVGLWFMFALAPIFFICLLFQRTARLFEGWLNMVINFTLQPILLFAFFSFFIVMITASLESLFDVVWCWKPVWQIYGTPIEWWWWRPTIIRGVTVPYGGEVDYGILGIAEHPLIPFPLQLIDVFFFLMSSYLGLQYGKFVPQLSNQLSQGGLTVGASMDDMRQFFSTRGWTPEQIGTRTLGTVGKFFR